MLENTNFVSANHKTPVVLESNRSEEYDSDEEQDDKHTHGAVDDDGNVNSQLAVGFKHDRSFVVRGDKIGVFKHVGDKDLEFTTTIQGLKTPGGKAFQPSKVRFIIWIPSARF